METSELNNNSSGTGKANNEPNNAAPLNTSLVESPVLNALRSHIEKWYPELSKNKLEVEDILNG